jgi:hypothetical protein
MAARRWFQLRIPREGVDLKMATKMSYDFEGEVGGNPTGVGVKSSSQQYGYREDLLERSRRGYSQRCGDSRG